MVCRNPNIYIYFFGGGGVEGGREWKGGGKGEGGVEGRGEWRGGGVEEGGGGAGGELKFSCTIYKLLQIILKFP